MFPWKPPGTARTTALVGDIEGLDAVHRHVGSERRIGADGESDRLAGSACRHPWYPEDCHRLLSVFTADSQRRNERRRLENRIGLGRGKAIEKWRSIGAKRETRSRAVDVLRKENTALRHARLALQVRMLRQGAKRYTGHILARGDVDQRIRDQPLDGVGDKLVHAGGGRDNGFQVGCRRIKQRNTDGITEGCAIGCLRNGPALKGGGVVGEKGRPVGDERLNCADIHAGERGNGLREL